MDFLKVGHSVDMLIVAVGAILEQPCVAFFSSQRGNFAVLTPNLCDEGNGPRSLTLSLQLHERVLSSH